MAGPNKRNVFYARAREQALTLLADPEFMDEIKLEKPRYKEQQQNLIIDACVKRNMSAGCVEYILHFIQTGEHPKDLHTFYPIKIWANDSTLLGFPPTIEGMKVLEPLKELDQHVILLVGRETTRSDMEYFIEKNWQKEIVPRLKKIPLINNKEKVGRRQSSNKQLRNQSIRKEYSEGASYTDLAIKYDLSKSRIEQIVKKVTD